MIKSIVLVLVVAGVLCESAATKPTKKIVAVDTEVSLDKIYDLLIEIKSHVVDNTGVDTTDESGEEETTAEAAEESPEAKPNKDTPAAAAKPAKKAAKPAAKKVKRDVGEALKDLADESVDAVVTASTDLGEKAIDKLQDGIEAINCLNNKNKDEVESEE